ncbi:MAG: PH domain-containing protein [Bacteroidota bacterium]
MKFWSKREHGIAAILWMFPLFCSIGLFVLLLLSQLNEKYLIGFLTVSSLTVILFYLWYNTYYRIEDGQLIYQSGVFNGTIKINQIESIQRSGYPTTGNRPAMGLEGLLIRYQGGRRIFISPADEDGFMRELQKTNSRLRILPKSLQGG